MELDERRREREAIMRQTKEIKGAAGTGGEERGWGKQMKRMSSRRKGRNERKRKVSFMLT